MVCCCLMTSAPSLFQIGDGDARCEDSLREGSAADFEECIPCASGSGGKEEGHARLSAISSHSAVPLLKDEAHSKIPASSFLWEGEREIERKRARAHIESQDGNDAEMDDPTNPCTPTSGSRRSSRSLDRP